MDTHTARTHRELTLRIIYMLRRRGIRAEEISPSLLIRVFGPDWENDPRYREMDRLAWEAT